MDFIEKTINSELTFKGKVLSLYNDEVRLPNGRISHREVVRHRGAVCVLPISEEGDVYLVNQYRYPVDCVLLEAPAGKLEAGENPDDCAVRELKEETGITAGRITSLGKMIVSPGYCDEIIYLYAAQELSYGEQHPDEDEFLEVCRIPLIKAREMILSGEISDAKTQLILLKACYILGIGK